MIAVAAAVWCHDDRRVNKGVSPSRGVSGPAALKTTVIFRKRLIGHSPVTGPVRIVIYVLGCLIASKYTHSTVHVSMPRTALTWNWESTSAACHVCGAPQGCVLGSRCFIVFFKGTLFVKNNIEYRLQTFSCNKQTTVNPRQKSLNNAYQPLNA